MTADASVVEMMIDSDLKNVEAAEELVERVCKSVGFDEEDEHRIGMAVHESVINAIWHGNKNDPSKKVRLRLEIHPDRIEIHVKDQGHGFDPSRVANPLEDQNLLKVSGRGIFLIRSFMDEFRVESTPGAGTEVVLVKRLHSRMDLTEGGTHREHEGHNTPSR